MVIVVELLERTAGDCGANVDRGQNKPKTFVAGGKSDIVSPLVNGK